MCDRRRTSASGTRGEKISRFFERLVLTYPASCDIISFVSSNAAFPSGKNGRMAQLVEHIVHIDGVTGSSPVATTIVRPLVGRIFLKAIIPWVICSFAGISLDRISLLYTMVSIIVTLISIHTSCFEMKGEMRMTKALAVIGISGVNPSACEYWHSAKMTYGIMHLIPKGVRFPFTPPRRLSGGFFYAMSSPSCPAFLFRIGKCL